MEKPTLVRFCVPVPVVDRWKTDFCLRLLYLDTWPGRGPVEKRLFFNIYDNLVLITLILVDLLARASMKNAALLYALDNIYTIDIYIYIYIYIYYNIAIYSLK